MPTLTKRQRDALIRIDEAYRRHYAGEYGAMPLGRFDVGQPGRAIRPAHQTALHEAGLIHIGTMVHDHWLIPTDAGKQLVRDLALAAGNPDPYPHLASPQETSTMTATQHYADTDTAIDDPDTPVDPVAISIPIGDLHPRPENLRDNADGTDLVHSIVRHGILQPLNVTPRAEGGYWINAGHRRHDGAQRAGLMFLPCIVTAIETDTDVAFTMLIENLQRRDLNPIEEARGYQRLVDLGCNQAEIAEHTGRSPSVVSRRLKLLTLPDDAIERVAAGTLALELAEKVARLDPEVAAIAVAHNWSEYKIDDAIDKADRQVKADHLAGLLDAAGVKVVPASKLGTWAAGSDTHKLTAFQPIHNPTLDDLKEADAKRDVVGLALVNKDTYHGGVRIEIVKKVKASPFEIDQRARQQERAANPDGPDPGDTTGADAAAARRRADQLNDARIHHTALWLDSLADRKWKAADVTLLLAVAAIHMLGNETPNTDRVLLGEPGGFGLEARDRLIDSLDGLAGAALHKAMAAIAADLLGYDLYELPDGKLLDLMERFGFEQLPDDHPLDGED